MVQYSRETISVHPGEAEPGRKDDGFARPIMLVGIFPKRLRTHQTRRDGIPLHNNPEDRVSPGAEVAHLRGVGPPFLYLHHQGLFFFLTSLKDDAQSDSSMILLPTS